MIDLIKHLVWLSLSLSCISGCTSVYIEDSGKVDKTYYPGIVFVKVTPSNGVTRIETSSLGMVLGTGRVALGWLKEDRVEVSDDCVIVFIDGDVSDGKHIIELLIESGVPPDHICVTKGEEKNESNGG